jgi:hypothetical protein
MYYVLDSFKLKIERWFFVQISSIAIPVRRNTLSIAHASTTERQGLDPGHELLHLSNLSQVLQAGLRQAELAITQYLAKLLEGRIPELLTH